MPAIVREKIKFTPSWDGPLFGWTLNYIRRNVWRTLPFLDQDDLLQEAFLCFNTCCKYYPGVVDPAHFMSLYKITFVRLMATLAMRRKPIGKLPESEILSGESTSDDRMDRLEIQMLIEDAPECIKRLLKAVQRPRRPRCQRIAGCRETTRQYLCRLAGLDADTDVLEIISNWMTGVVQCPSPSASR